MRATRRALILASSLLAAHSAPALSFLPAGRFLFPAITNAGADKNAVALTFDDGPDVGTEKSLDLLDEAGIQATFFAVGEQVERAPARLQEIASRGHEIGVHCYRHRNHLRLTPAQTVEDMRRARAIIEEVAEVDTRLFRPPYGVFNLASWLEASRQEWERVLWARWGRDWERRATPRSISDKVGYPRSGDIILLHDSDRYASPGSWRNTLAALPIILKRISDSNLQMLPVGELLETG